LFDDVGCERGATEKAKAEQAQFIEKHLKLAVKKTNWGQACDLRFCHPLASWLPQWKLRLNSSQNRCSQDSRIQGVKDSRIQGFNSQDSRVRIQDSDAKAFGFVGFCGSFSSTRRKRRQPAHYQSLPVSAHTSTDKSPTKVGTLNAPCQIRIQPTHFQSNLAHFSRIR
jgi:hypothetical protein